MILSYIMKSIPTIKVDQMLQFEYTKKMQY